MNPSTDHIESAAPAEASSAQTTLLGEIASATREVGTFTVLMAGWTALNVALYLHRL